MTTPSTPSAPPEPIRDELATLLDAYRKAKADRYIDDRWYKTAQKAMDLADFIDKDAAHARLAALTLTAPMRGMLQDVNHKYNLEEYSDVRGKSGSDVEQDVANLLAIIDRLTRTDGDT